MSITIRADQLMQGLGLAVAAYVAMQNLKSPDLGDDAAPLPPHADEQQMVPVYREIALREQQPVHAIRLPSIVYIGIGILIGVAVMLIVADIANEPLPSPPQPQMQARRE